MYMNKLNSVNFDFHIDFKVKNRWQPPSKWTHYNKGLKNLFPYKDEM